MPTSLPSFSALRQPSRSLRQPSPTVAPSCVPVHGPMSPSCVPVRGAMVCARGAESACPCVWCMCVPVDQKWSKPSPTFSILFQSLSCACSPSSYDLRRSPASFTPLAPAYSPFAKISDHLRKSPTVRPQTLVSDNLRQSPTVVRPQTLNCEPYSGTFRPACSRRRACSFVATLSMYLARCLNSESSRFSRTASWRQSYAEASAACRAE